MLVISYKSSTRETTAYSTFVQGIYDISKTRGPKRRAVHDEEFDMVNNVVKTCGNNNIRTIFHIISKIRNQVLIYAKDHNGVIYRLVNGNWIIPTNKLGLIFNLMKVEKKVMSPGHLKNLFKYPVEVHHETKKLIRKVKQVYKDITKMQDNLNNSDYRSVKRRKKLARKKRYGEALMDVLMPYLTGNIGAICRIDKLKRGINKATKVVKKVATKLKQRPVRNKIKFHSSEEAPKKEGFQLNGEPPVMEQMSLNPNGAVETHTDPSVQNTAFSKKAMEMGEVDGDLLDNLNASLAMFNQNPDLAILNPDPSYFEDDEDDDEPQGPTLAQLQERARIKLAAYERMTPAEKLIVDAEDERNAARNHASGGVWM